MALLVMMDFAGKRVALMSNFGILKNGTWLTLMLTARETAAQYVIDDMTEVWRERDSRRTRRLGSAT